MLSFWYSLHVWLAALQSPERLKECLAPIHSIPGSIAFMQARLSLHGFGTDDDAFDAPHFISSVENFVSNTCCIAQFLPFGFHGSRWSALMA